MDIGKKVKEALHASHSSEAARGEVDQKTPGSFPADDMATQSDPQQTSAIGTSGREHNKLHKQNDPRARAGEDKTARGHSYNDSGVGLTDNLDRDRAPTDFTPSQAQAGIGEDTYGDAPDHYQSNFVGERTESKSDATAPGTTGLVLQPDLDSEAGLRTEEKEANPLEGKHIVIQEDETGALTASENPYWGNLPRGAGVYNTVAGHGSPEDANKRHQEIHGGEHMNLPSTAATNLASGESAHDFHQRPITEDTTNINPPKASQELSHQKDSHFKEGVAGVGVAGAAATGAYEVGKKQNEDKGYSNLDETANPAHSGSGRHDNVTGVMHTEQRHRNDHKVKDKAAKDNHAKDPEQGKESKLSALLHRGDHKKKENEPEMKRETPEEKDSGFNPTPGAALAGIGGVSTYEAMKHRDDDDGAQGRKSNNQGLRPDTQSRSVHYGTSTQTPSEGQTTHPTALSSNFSPAQDNEQSRKETTHNRDNIVTPAVAGSGAGAALGSQAMGMRESDLNKSAPANKGLIDPTSTYPPGVDSSAIHGTTDSGNPLAGSNRTTASKAITSPEDSTTYPDFTSYANEGKYNTLASGTPSGVKLDSEVNEQQKLPRDTQLEQGNRHGTDTSAILGATGIGTDATKVQQQNQEKVIEARPGEEEKFDRLSKNDSTTGARDEAPSSTTVPRNLGSEKVIHKCQKCGEENDISKYFTSKASGLN